MVIWSGYSFEYETCGEEQRGWEPLLWRVNADNRHGNRIKIKRTTVHTLERNALGWNHIWKSH